MASRAFTLQKAIPSSQFLPANLSSDDFNNLIGLSGPKGARVGVPYVLYKNNVPFVRTGQNVLGAGPPVGDDQEVTMVTIPVPAMLLSGNTSIFLHCLWRVTNSVITKTLICRIGGLSSGNVAATGATVMPVHSMVFHADNAANKQKIVNGANAGWETAGAALDRTADMSVANTITLSCLYSGACTDAIAAEAVTCVVYPG